MKISSIRYNSKETVKEILRPPYYLAKDLYLYYRNNKLMLRNEVLKNKYEGKRVFFLLSGESINQIDVLKLKNEFTFGYGYLILHKDTLQLPLSFFLSTDKQSDDKPTSAALCNFPKQLNPLNKKNLASIFLKSIGDCFINYGVITFLNADGYRFIKKNKLVNTDNDNIYYVKADPFISKTTNPKIDLTKRFTGGGGGFINAIMIMIYMGFKEIYLCGAGYTYSPLYYLHFYDNFTFSKSLGKEKAIIEAKKAIECRNKKDPAGLEYYGLLEKGDLFRGIYIKRVSKDYAEWKKHRIIKEYAESQGVKILNIVPEGFESPVFERMTWGEVVQKVLSNRLVNNR